MGSETDKTPSPCAAILIAIATADSFLWAWSIRWGSMSMWLQHIHNSAEFVAPQQRGRDVWDTWHPFHNVPLFYFLCNGDLFGVKEPYFLCLPLLLSFFPGYLWRRFSDLAETTFAIVTSLSWAMCHVQTQLTRMSDSNHMKDTLSLLCQSDSLAGWYYG